MKDESCIISASYTRVDVVDAPRARAGSAADISSQPSGSAGFANRSPWVASPVIKPRELMALV